MSTAVPPGFGDFTAAYHTTPQGAAAIIRGSITVRNDGAGPVQVDYFVTEDQNNSACIAAGSLVYQGGGLPEHKEFTALTGGLSAGTHRWDLWMAAHGSQAFILENWLMPCIAKA